MKDTRILHRCDDPSHKTIMAFLAWMTMELGNQRLRVRSQTFLDNVYQLAPRDAVPHYRRECRDVRRECWPQPWACVGSAATVRRQSTRVVAQLSGRGTWSDGYVQSCVLPIVGLPTNVQRGVMDAIAAATFDVNRHAHIMHVYYCLLIEATLNIREIELISKTHTNDGPVDVTPAMVADSQLVCIGALTIGKFMQAWADRLQARREVCHMCLVRVGVFRRACCDDGPPVCQPCTGSVGPCPKCDAGVRRPVQNPCVGCRHAEAGVECVRGCMCCRDCWVVGDSCPACGGEFARAYETSPDRGVRDVGEE